MIKTYFKTSFGKLRIYAKFAQLLNRTALPVLLLALPMFVITSSLHAGSGKDLQKNTNKHIYTGAKSEVSQMVDLTNKKNTKHCFIFTELSENLLLVDNNFNKHKIAVFGQKSCPDGKMIFTIQGRKKKFNVVKKERKAHMWISGKTVVFPEVPSLYFLKTRYNLESILDPKLMQNLSIGLKYIRILSKTVKNQDVDPDVVEDLFNARQSILKTQIYRGLFTQEQQNKKDITETKSLFKGVFVLPKNLQQGIYTFETFIVLNNTVCAIVMDPLTVYHVGLGASIRHIAINNKIVYYCCCLLFAIGCGVLAFMIVEIITDARIKARRI
ncbi:MAG: TIGR02186 family protein [Alphaproteobacteria bacterium]|nr:TIGR02186 family protein [Rickettsiales bacterium]